MKKKIIAIAMIAALGLTAIGGATMAYFTDNDQKSNNFTIGNIDIELEEDCYVWDNSGTDYPLGSYVRDACTENADGSGYTFSNLMPSYIISKRAYVENTSDRNSAYVRVAVVVNNLEEINDAIDETYECKQGDHSTCKKTATGACYTADDIQKIYDNVFCGWGVQYDKVNPHTTDRNGDTNEAETVRGWMVDHLDQDGAKVYAIDMAAQLADSGGSYQRYSPTNYFQSADEKANNKIWADSNRYSNGTFDAGSGKKSYYDGALSDNSRVFVFYLKLDPGKKFDLFDKNNIREGGLNVPADFNEEQMEMFQNLNISIYADAIQTVGFKGTTDSTGTFVEDWQQAFDYLEAEHPLGWWNSTTTGA